MVHSIRSHRSGENQHLGSFPRVFIIPFWLQPILKANRLTASEFIKKDIQEKYLSIEDQKLFHATNRAFYKFFDVLFDEASHAHLFISEEEEDHYKQKALTFLNLENDDSIPEQTYRIEHYNEEYFLIYVEAGFLNILGYRDQVIKLISDCLQVQFSYTPYSVVHGGRFYYHYLNLINPKIPFNLSRAFFKLKQE